MPTRKGREKEYDREWRARNRERVHKNNLAWNAGRYGMSREEYDRFLERPCMICSGQSQVVDHDHKTGQVRGPLCHRCNRGLGFFLDDHDRLSSAVRYLKEFLDA